MWAIVPHYVNNMSFLTPWVSQLGGWMCDASATVLPTGAQAAVCGMLTIDYFR